MKIEQEQKEVIKWYQDNITAIHQLASRGEEKYGAVCVAMIVSLALNLLLALSLLIVVIA